MPTKRKNPLKADVQLASIKDVGRQRVLAEESVDGLVIEVYRAPIYFQNPFITRGYRIHFSFWQALQSVFYPHNEWLNIWTALLPAFFFFYEAVSYAFCVNGGVTAGMALGYGLAHLGIAIFHTFHCMSHPIKILLASIDYASIALIGFSSQLAGNQIFAQHGLDTEFRVWTVANILINVAVSIVCLVPRVRESRPLRFIVFSLTALGPVVQSLHMKELLPGNLAVSMHRYYIFEHVGLFGVGVFFFLARIPERFASPGTFCIFGNSHQIWHLFFAGSCIRYLFTSQYFTSLS